METIVLNSVVCVSLLRGMGMGMILPTKVMDSMLSLSHFSLIIFMYFSL